MLFRDGSVSTPATVCFPASRNYQQNKLHLTEFAEDDGQDYDFPNLLDLLLVRGIFISPT